MKKLSILLALLLSVSIFATSCGKKIDESASSGASSSSSVSDSEDKSSSGDSSKQDSNESSKDDEDVIDVDSSSKANENVKLDQTMKETSKVRYGYSTLSADEKAIYDKILDAVYNFKDEVDFGKEITYETYSKVYKMIYFQETQLFWMRGVLQPFDNSTSKTAPLYYTCDKATAAEMQKKIDAKAAEIVASFPSGASAVDKLLAIHDYIGKNCSFTDVKDSGSSQTIYGGLIEGKVQCEGYAKTMGFLCDKAGIENLLIVGENNKQLSHAWNMVKIDGEWYNIDITWDDPTGNSDPNFVIHNYFNVTDAEILNISHFQDLDTTAFTPPKATATKANYFVYYKLYVKSTDEALSLMQQEMTKSAKAKKPVAEIKCSSKEVYDAAHTAVVNKAIEMQQKANSESGNKITALADGSDSHTYVIRINLTY